MLLFRLYLLLVFLCLLSAIIFRRHLPPYFRWLRVLLGLTLLIEGISYYLKSRGVPNTFLYHIYQPIEYGLLSLVYFRALSRKLVKNLILISIPLYILACLLITIFLQKTTAINTIGYMIESLLLIGWISWYFYELYTREVYIKLWREPLFWISTGLLFYYAGTFLVTGSLNLLKKENIALARKLFTINQTLNFLLYFTFIMGFACKKIIPK